MSKDIEQLMKEGFKKTDAAIENLATMTAHGFERTDKRLDKMDGRLDKMDGRLDHMDGRLDKMDGRLDHIENLLIRDNVNRIEQLEDRMKIVETSLA